MDINSAARTLTTLESVPVHTNRLNDNIKRCVMKKLMTKNLLLSSITETKRLHK
ncbi:hypothetical protein DFA_04445 [Cavenderia fasciculata]|uniref:Uncharacterized protein n=1 Tax=Cavenderia fasciculata TaxID=261658 RepID=F4PPL4_CACFS|nr:uncharacterized protein DFA_04445 [Cavenderia fasciculata]EGG22327.1 hypothetical protein DFA_04445 [Cavenderia fasciculata]|eukprot:XP_004360178.1 hypothetical protein DFA_04445 [Cavenderia fasciculata]